MTFKTFVVYLGTSPMCYHFKRNKVEKELDKLVYLSWNKKDFKNQIVSSNMSNVNIL